MIEIKNIEKTKLNKKALLKVIERYSKSKKNILISFDGRLESFGIYTYSSKKKRHEIKISTKTFQFKDAESRTYETIGTLLHEMKHLQQQEQLGSLFFMSRKFCWNDKIRSFDGSDYFSLRECEARTFEEKNVFLATEYYWKMCKGVVR